MRLGDLVDALQERLNSLRNSVQSRHDTEELEDCHNCGKKPARYWSHRGVFIACKCGQMIFTGAGNNANVADLWDRMNEQKKRAS